MTKAICHGGTGVRKSEEGGKSGVSQAFTEWKMVCLSVTLLI